MGVLLQYNSVCLEPVWCLQQPESGAGSPGTGVIRIIKNHNVCAGN